MQFINHLFTRGARKGDSCCAAAGWAQGTAAGGSGAADGIPPGGDGEQGLAGGEGRCSCKILAHWLSELKILPQVLGDGSLPGRGYRAGDAVPAVAGYPCWSRVRGDACISPRDGEPCTSPIAGAQRPTRPPSSPKSRRHPIDAATALGPGERWSMDRGRGSAGCSERLAGFPAW